MTNSRSRSVTGAHVQTTREQLQQQRLYIYRLTPMKCPHLLSHEMTGQVDSNALDQFLSSPHVVSYPAVVSCSAELCCVLGKDGLRYRLRTPCKSEHSVFIGQYSNKRTTYQSATELVNRHASHTVHEEIGTTASSSHREIHCIPRWVMDVYVVFHVQIELLLANGINLHFFTESVTPSKQIVTSGTQVSNGKKEWAFSFC